ncbi:hypothetical protein [Ruegeria sp. HKCCD7559]|uniref:hypothetical protein n=1 Tax=Ruegeria TaxID=97050 RepID=UPI001491FBDD|nr:hypothetical protein [Ruegeria sp. HKCCD7559]NOC47327.1 hypothetical protein [Ruegeria sp. HKCCD7559]
MELIVEFDSQIAAEKGVVTEDMLADLEAEIDGFAKHVGASSIGQSKKPAPDGAQGELELLQFLIEVAKEPMAIKAGISSLVYALNEIASAKGKSAVDDPAEKKVAKLKVLGKEIVLPASIAVIKQFIEEVTRDD